jgi:hypothetical protein
MSFVLVAKPTDHKLLFQWVEELEALGGVDHIKRYDQQGRRHLYRWVNQVPLNGSRNAGGHQNQRAPESSGLQLPVRVVAVVFVDAVSPIPVREIRPLGVLVKPGSGLQLFLVHVEDELVLMLGELECTPRHGEQLVPHTQEATEGENRVGQATFLGVDNQFVDLAQIFILAIGYRLTDDFGCRDDTHFRFIPARYCHSFTFRLSFIVVALKTFGHNGHDHTGQFASVLPAG